MALKLANNATSTLASSIDDTVTTVSVQAADAALFPALGEGDWFPVTLVDGTGAIEIMHVTERAGAALTVARGREGTAARAFDNGARIDIRLTKGALEHFNLAEQIAAAASGEFADTSSLVARTAAGGIVRQTWAAIKGALKTAFDQIYAAVDHSHDAATPLTAGFMSGTDKAKLDGLDEVFEEIGNDLEAIDDALADKLNKDAGNVGDAAAQAAFRAAIGAISEGDIPDVPPVENLDADVITTGTFDAARIPNLNASKINSGVFPEARLTAPAAGNAVYSAGGGVGSLQAPQSGSMVSGGINIWAAIRAGAVTMYGTLNGTGGAQVLQAHKNGTLVGSVANGGTLNLTVSIVPGDLISLTCSATNGASNCGIRAASATVPAVVRLQ